MQRFIVKVIVSGVGQIQHVTRAKSKKDAEARIKQAYPNAELVFISVTDAAQTGIDHCEVPKAR